MFFASNKDIVGGMGSLEDGVYITVMYLRELEGRLGGLTLMNIQEGSPPHPYL
jgi:hypothetical protein